MKSIIKYPMLFLFGGSIYYLLEITFRGYSFPAMVVCGGLCSDCICGITAICLETFLVRYALSSQCCGSFCQHLESSWMIISGGCFLERRSRIIICSGKRKREEKENDKATDYFKALVGNL